MLKWIWICCARDSRSSWSADFDGICRARSKKDFDSEDAARAAAQKHVKNCPLTRQYGESLSVQPLFKRRNPVLRKRK